MVKLFTSVAIYSLLLVGTVCNGQSTEVIDFIVAEPVPVSKGQWLTFSNRAGIKSIDSPYDESETILLMAKSGLLRVLSGEGLPISFNSLKNKDKLAKTKINYRLSYGAKPDDDNARYILRWERTGPVTPKSVTLEIKKEGGSWVVEDKSSGHYFWYISNTWSRHHKKIFSPSSKVKNKALNKLITQCKISNSTKFILDADCAIRNLQDLSDVEISNIYASLK